MDDVSQQETKSQPRVTALVVSYNDIEALRRCLTALEASKDRESLEIIVVDKGSRDGSSQIDVEFPSITPLRLPRNFGNTKALNIGMRTAAADLIFFLVPETEVQPDTISRLAACVDADPDAVAVCPLAHDRQFFRLPASGTELEVQTVDDSAEAVPVEGATFDAAMARKYFIRGLNYLDEKYGECWSDVDLAFQIRRAGKKIIAVPSIKVAYTPRADAMPDDALALLEADKIAGAARYYGKYSGFFSGILVRIKATLMALLSFRFGLLSSVLSGRKVDGTQSEL